MNFLLRVAGWYNKVIFILVPLHIPSLLLFHQPIRIINLWNLLIIFLKYSAFYLRGDGKHLHMDGAVVWEAGSLGQVVFTKCLLSARYYAKLREHKGMQRELQSLHSRSLYS